jgi:hypothetical protein
MNDGTKVNVSINVTFVEGKMNSSNDKVLGFEKGDNLLYLKKGVTRNNTMGAIGNSVIKMKVGYKVVMDSEGDYYSRDATVVHDVMHQLRLGDRYYDARDGSPTVAHSDEFKTDLLGLGPQTDYLGKGFTFSKEHFKNFAITLFKKVEIKAVGENCVENHSVDEKPKK